MNTDKVTLEFDIGTTEPGAMLGVRASMDGTVFYNNSHVTETYHVTHEISDDDLDHVLEIELFGKLPEHTKVNEAGEIVQDAMLEISHMQFDGIDIEQIISPEYHHDFNGSQDAIVDEFFGHMGCNGTVKVKFTTPIYLWLLENM